MRPETDGPGLACARGRRLPAPRSIKHPSGLVLPRCPCLPFGKDGGSERDVEGQGVKTGLTRRL